MVRDVIITRLCCEQIYRVWWFLVVHTNGRAYATVLGLRLSVVVCTSPSRWTAGLWLLVSLKSNISSTHFWQNDYLSNSKCSPLHNTVMLRSLSLDSFYNIKVRPIVVLRAYTVFTARCTLVQSAVLRLHVVCPSVRPSVRNVGGLCSHRLQFFENNFTTS